ncbi:MAG TPA: alpha/beta hydrolase [Cyclobacteriaceae bacterium]|nr:alpha/beta hydrolase [Cyclobacteriaceae bacterium]
MDAIRNQPTYNQAYIDTGDGPVVILLHGLFGKVSMWKRTIENLKKNFRVIVPRLPLFELPAENVSIRQLSTYLHEFIEWHRLDDVYIVGHGIGGQVALVYAAEHPIKVNKIVLSGSGLFQDKELGSIISAGAEHNELVGDTVRSAFYNSYLAGDALVTDISRTINDTSARANIENLLRSSAEEPVESKLNKLDHRVMLLWGLEDRITPPAVTFHFLDFLQNSEIRFIEKCGHLPMVEEPERFVRHLASFFGQDSS